ncbi:primosomal protein N', partial [mine drainage metagenome]
MDLQSPVIVEVLLDLPLPRGFDYYAALATEEDVGRRVKVPWGTGQKVGVIRALKHTSTYPADKIKEVLEIWRDVPPLNARDWQLLEFCSSYYHYPLGQTVLAMLPPALRRVGGWQPPRRVRQPRKYLSQSSAPPLNEAQRSVVQAILQQPNFAVHLIHGVTGSGKTEVYFSLIEKVLERGRQVLLLVPEINLTPQLEQRLARRWPNLNWISLHSGVSEKERARRWLTAQTGAARLVLGTRLAVFTPLPELGLIVVDEEHEASFKQQDGLRYSARDLAIVRARQGEFPIILGSATPT